MEDDYLRQQTNPLYLQEYKRLANFGVKRDLGPFAIDKKLGGFGVKRLGNFGVKRLAGFNIKRNSDLSRLLSFMRDCKDC